MTQHVTLDFHDDPRSVLMRLSATEIRTLDDSVLCPRADLVKVASNRFALLIRTSAGDVPKYLCDSPTNTLLSVRAFDLYGDRLPEGMRKVAAFHLSQAAELYGVPFPGVLPEARFATNVVVGALPVQQQEKVANTISGAVEALNWFDEFGFSLPPLQRHQIAESIHAMCKEAAVKLSGAAAGYCGSLSRTYAAAIGLRKHFSNDPRIHAWADQLVEDAEAWGPEKVAASLAALDREGELEHLWDNQLSDPWASVFGNHRTLEKTASTLADRVQEHEAALRAAFDDALVDGLLRDPEVVRDSLPRPEREIFDSVIGG